MKKSFNVAIVGCGTISYNHLVSLGLIDGCKTVALCDTDPVAAKTRRDEFCPEARIYTDFYEMLNSEKLDSVHICTPHYLHAKMTVECLNRGINVFLEKPMAISENELDEMLAAEKSSTARAAVCFQNRFNDAFLYAKNLIEHSDECFSGYASVFWYRDSKYYTESAWRGRQGTEGGGVMINQAIHSLDMLITLLGKPVAVTATKANHHLKGVIDVEDTCEGVIEFENGSVGSFYATTAFPAGDRITLVLKSKSTVIEMRGFELSVNGEKIHFPEKKSYLGKEYYGSAHPDLIRKYYEALESGEKIPVSLESAQYAVRVLLAAYKSCDKRIQI